MSFPPEILYTLVQSHTGTSHARAKSGNTISEVVILLHAETSKTFQVRHKNRLRRNMAIEAALS